MSVMTKNLQSQWAAVAPILSIRNQSEYDAAVNMLNDLLDEIGTNDCFAQRNEHPLYSLLDTLGTLVHAYEEKHYVMPEVSGGEMLRYFMEEHGLRQSDLSEVGSQGVVSEVLNGTRELNVRQIRALAKRFHVSPAVFV